MADKAVNKRKFKRTKAKFTIVYDVYKPLSASLTIGGRQVDALMLDLGKAGMAISSSYDVPVSTVLNMNFTLINHQSEDDNRVISMQILGEVRSCTLQNSGEYRLGICFVRITEENKKAIESFVEAMSSPPKNDEG
ncbi:MAG: PilZ domain-containing protein [Candidatus Omnitrophica bacterium]|nr:PilZ domain-containing protein [Candidatus Omnitrophota bacterium]MBU1905893.1 PilZ domain-containing protein [Candidatus Omnitrophota bacterium]